MKKFLHLGIGLLMGGICSLNAAETYRLESSVVSASGFSRFKGCPSKYFYSYEGGLAISTY